MQRSAQNAALVLRLDIKLYPEHAGKFLTITPHHGSAAHAEYRKEGDCWINCKFIS